MQNNKETTFKIVPLGSEYTKTAMQIIFDHPLVCLADEVVIYDMHNKIANVVKNPVVTDAK